MLKGEARRAGLESQTGEGVALGSAIWFLFQAFRYGLSGASGELVNLYQGSQPPPVP